MATRHTYDDEAVGSVARNKKRNAALSCQECRRLKLKCDRKFPCSACVKRGCSQICPDGSLTTGKGNRFVLANTESLHEKITELSLRVRSLEDALRVAHTAFHGDPHPLLSEELLRIKNPLEREVIAQQPKVSEEEDTLDAVGSLSISPSGRNNFYGSTANAWYLLQNEDEEHTEGETEHAFALRIDVSWLSHAFPFSPSLAMNHAAAEELRNTLLAALPDAPTARYLADTYFEHASWMYHPVTKERFDEDIFARIYPYATFDSPVDTDTDRDAGSYESHRLALLFIVLAVGILVDFKRPSHDPAAVTFFQLSRAALSIAAVMEEPSVTVIQALVIMCHYMFLNEVDSQRWTLMGIVVKLVQSMGLHRDSILWKLSTEEIQLRRALFWEVYVYDSWQSLTYGRPPSLAMAHIDCKMAHETTKNTVGEVEMSFDAWKHRFSSECLSIIHDQVFGARTPSYDTVMELDKRVQKYYIPPSLQVPGFGNAPMYTPGEGPPTLKLTMQRYIILAIKEVTLLYMHRGFFARAMADNPADPLSGKYGRSVLRAHESASFFVKLVKSLWSQQRVLTERNWFLFTHVFSCAIVLGSIPAKCPSMPLAVSALRDLDQIHELFTNMGEKTRAAKVLPILTKLRERAHVSLEEYQTQSKTKVPAVNTKRESSQELITVKTEDELSTLSGKTRLVSKKPPSSTSPRGSRSPTSSPSATFNSHNSASPISPTSPADYTHTPLFGGVPAQIHPPMYTSSSQIPLQQQATSPMEPSPTVHYHASPELALFGSRNQQQSAAHSQPHFHPQQFQSQQSRPTFTGHRRSQSQQAGPSSGPPQPVEWIDHNMSYDPPAGVSTHVAIFDAPRPAPARPQQSIPDPNFNNLYSFDSNIMGGVGQYGLGDYYGIGGVDVSRVPQGFAPIYAQQHAEMFSAQDMQTDLNVAWTDLMNEAQYGMTH